MNSIMFFISMFACLVLMLTMTYSFTLSSKIMDDDHHANLDHPTVIVPNKIHLMHQYDDSRLDDIDEHELAKRRFNAWAGKRALVARRPFNSWAGRR